jgi:site-specific DNA recombinase
MSPELAEAAVEAYRLEREARDKQLAKDRRALERELADVKVGLRRVMDMVVKGIGEQAKLGREMKDLAARERELEATLATARTPTVATLQPHAARRYRAKVNQILEALTKGDAAVQGAVALVRTMIERILITPRPDRMDLQVFGELSMLLGNKPGTDGELGDCLI